MALDIGGAIRRGVRRVGTRQGAMLVAGFAAVGVGVALLWESVLGRFVAGDDFFAVVPPELATELRGAWANYEVLLDLGLPVEVLLGLVILLWFVRLVLRIGAIRWFVGDTNQPLTAELFTDRLGWTVLNLLAGTILYGVAVVIGLVLLVVPGVFLAVALFFFNYEIVIEGENAIDALVNSWSLTDGHRFRLFLLGGLFVALGLGVSSLGNPTLIPGRLAPAVVGATVSAAFGVFGIATAADAYTQLQNAADTVDEPVSDELAAN
ncbi:MAG: hypothetical protein ABEH64_07345 [Salinirussus sp.]